VYPRTPAKRGRGAGREEERGGEGKGVGGREERWNCAVVNFP